MLKQPSIFNLLICALRKSFGRECKSKGVLYPRFVGPYKLIFKVKKINNINNYGIGTYKDMEGKKVFIKTWQRKIKNFPYYSLINEYNMAKLLSEKIKNVKEGKFRVPSPVGYVKTDNSLSVIFEYIDGKPLSKFSRNEQSRVINGVILFLDRLTPTINKNDKKYIKKRGIFFYLFSLPVIFLYSFLLEKESKKTIFRSFLRTVFYSITLFNKRLALAHGDLSPENVLVTDSHFYILDTEDMKYTLVEYDLNHLSIVKSRLNLYLSILKKRRDFTRDNFLCLYISLQFSIFRDSRTMQRPYFDYLKN